MSQPFRERLAAGPILADGAMGTLLHARGVPVDACFDALNLTAPEVVLGVHRDYLAAGAEIVETNTFGANRYKLAEHGLADETRAVNQAGVRLARQAVDEAGGNAYIAGSVGPLGVRLAPVGRVAAESAYDAFREQIDALCGADLLMLETFSDLRELEQAVRAARDVCELPVVAQVTFTRDDRTLLGDTPAQVAETLAGLGVEVVGVNCSNGPAQIMRIVHAMQSALPDRESIRFSAVPNAGWPEYVGGRVMYASGPEYFAETALALRAEGVCLVGGCCGTTPEHIAAMRAALDDPRPVQVTRAADALAEAAEEMGEAPAPSALARKLARGDFVIAVEISPPRGVVPDRVLRAAQALADAGADAVDVTDSPMARMRMSPWAVCALLQERAGVETVLHFPTRGRNLLRVQGDLLAAHALGVRNLFVVMGDPTHIGDYPDAADNYDIVPSGLIHLIKHSLNEGRDWAGNRIGQPTNFLVSAALNLNPADPVREFRVLNKKLDAGVDYVLAQPVFDPAVYDRFMDAYEAAHGAPPGVPVLVGLLPLYSAQHARFLHNEVPGIDIPDAVMARVEVAGDDAPQEGVRIAQELIEGLAGRAAGLYVMPQFGRYDLAAEVVAHARGLAG
jgi:methionine synthase I (cobalamin-dependent)/5,10-methylenetetrahydrofolate reductase